MPGKRKRVGSSFPNRIVGYGEMDPATLVANPRNWRLHQELQMRTLGAVLEEVGWVDAVKVNRTTGFVVDGHARVAVALQTGQTTVPVMWVELTEAEERAVLLTFDPLTGMASEVEERRKALAEEVETQREEIQRMVDAAADRRRTAAGDPPREEEAEPTEHPREPEGGGDAEDADPRASTGQVWEIPSRTVAGSSHFLLERTEHASVSDAEASREIAIVLVGTDAELAAELAEARRRGLHPLRHA